MQRISICHSTAKPVDADRGKERLALTRLLIWAEQESVALGCEGAAAHLRDAIKGLYDD